MVGRDVTVPRSVLADPTWDYVALGHIHKHQDLNAGAHPPVVYSGSVERVDFGEEKEPKGWVLAEVGRGRTSYQFITQHQRQARRFVTIDCDCRQAADPTDEVLKAIARREVADAIVRVRVELRPDQEAGLKERTIRAALAEAYEVAAISREVEGAVRSRWGAINVEALTPMQQLELFFRSSNVPETQVKGLLADADAIIREVDAALVAAS